MRVLTLFAVLAAGVVGAVVTGSDDAKGEPRAVAPEPQTTRDELRQIADHYRKLTQTYERVARRPATPSTATYRRASSRRYLQWTIDLWQARAVHARGAALATVQRRAHVELPQAPPTRAPIVQRIAYHRDVAWRLQRALPQRTTPSTDSFRTTQSADYRRWALHLWQERAAEAALAVSQKAPAPACRPRPRRSRRRSCASIATRARGTRTPGTATTAASRWTGRSCAPTAATSSRGGGPPMRGRCGRRSRRRLARTGPGAASSRGRTPPAPAVSSEPPRRATALLKLAPAAADSLYVASTTRATARPRVAPQAPTGKARAEKLVESYRRLAEVFHEVLSEHHPEAVLDRIADTLAGLVPYDALHIYEADPDRRELLPVLVRSDYVDEILGSRPAYGEGITGWAVLHRVPGVDERRAPRSAGRHGAGNPRRAGGPDHAPARRARVREGRAQHVPDRRGRAVRRRRVRACEVDRRRRGARDRQRAGARAARAPGADRLADRRLQPPLVPRAARGGARARLARPRHRRAAHVRHRRLQARERRPRPRRGRRSARRARGDRPRRRPHVRRRLPHRRRGVRGDHAVVRRRRRGRAGGAAPGVRAVDGALAGRRRDALDRGCGGAGVTR